MSSPQKAQSLWELGPKFHATVGGYMLVSASMLLVNKVAVTLVPAAAIILFLQFASAAVALNLAGKYGLCDVDQLNYDKLKKFWMVSATHIATIYTSMKAIQYVNVETFIVFRASTPIVLSALDYLFLGYELPTQRSTFSLLGLIVGAASYAMTDSSFQVNGYFWLCCWYIIICFNFVYIKHVINTVEMTSWGRAYYSNFLGSIWLFFAAIGTGEYAVHWDITVPKLAALVLSCALGIAMSYFGFAVRQVASPTMMGLIGNVCKVLTVVTNCIIWDKHASNFGLASLFLCLVAAYFYEQAPKRNNTSQDEKYELAESGKA